MEELRAACYLKISIDFLSLDFISLVSQGGNIPPWTCCWWTEKDWGVTGWLSWAQGSWNYRESKEGVSRTATLNTRSLVGRVPWEAILEGREVRKAGHLSMRKSWRHRNRLSLCAKGWAGERRPGWLNRELWLELRGKEKVSLSPLDDGVGSSGGLQGCQEVMQGENWKSQLQLNLATAIKVSL